MPLILLLIFVIIPLTEIAVFIIIGDIIGIPATIALVIITALIGTALLRMQGLSVLQRTQTAIQEGRIPVDSVIDGLCLLIAGAFLLTPGIITDTIGFLLFIPQFRRWLAQAIFQRIIKSSDIKFSEFRQDIGESPQHSREPDSGSGPIIDVEPIEVPPETTDHRGDDGKLVTRNNHRKSPWNRTSK